MDFHGVVSDGDSGALKFTVSSGIAGLHAANTYSGGTEVVGQSRLILSADGVIPDTSALYLSGGSMLETSGFDEVIGSLSALVAAGIDFGNGSSELWFADSSAQTWLGELPLLNFDIGLDSLRFGTDSSALTAAQISSIRLPGYAASLDPAGYVIFTPVPEPGMPGLAIAGILLLACVRRSRARS